MQQLLVQFSVALSLIKFTLYNLLRFLQQTNGVFLSFRLEPKTIGGQVNAKR